MSLKTEAIEAIKFLPDSATAADIQYRLYVVRKVARSEQSLKKHGPMTHAAAAMKLKRWLIA